jgi:hypothetical protein
MLRRGTTSPDPRHQYLSRARFVEARKTDGDEGLGVDERPVTRYATAPDGLRIAYQVIGEGAVDLVIPPAITVPIDLYWDEPGLARFLNRLSRFSRTVICDHRGMGASGGSFEDHLVEEITDADLTAVLDSARSERSVLAGSQRHHPNQPGRQCNPGTPTPRWIPGTGVAYMCACGVGLGGRY